MGLGTPAAGQVEPLEACAGVRLWEATHPQARRQLVPPAEYRRRYESDPARRPRPGELHLTGLVRDGGLACGHPLRGGPVPTPSIGDAIGRMGEDQPVVPYEHSGVGGWLRNAGSDLHLDVPGVPPPALVEGRLYDARAILRYSRGVGVFEGTHVGVGGALGSPAAQPLKGWHEHVSTAPGESLEGTVRIVESSLGTVQGRFTLEGQGVLRRAECPEDPGLLGVFGGRCEEEERRGRLRAAGSFFACREPVDPPPKDREDFVELDLVRHPVLYMTPEAFSEDPGAQEELFRRAGDVRDRQEAHGERLLEERTGGGEVVSVLKRRTQKAFVEGVLGKARRNEYDQIGQMDDMVRGRFDLRSGGDVHRLTRHLLWEQSDLPVRYAGFEKPRREVDVPECPCEGHGYPRYHVVVQDPGTGITHEWQIGTEAVSRVYELHGVDLPPGMDLDFDEGRIAADLHDVDYDVFRQGVKKEDDGMYEELRLDVFGTMLDELSAAAGCQGEALPDLQDRIRLMHEFASSRLHAVVDHYGLEKVRSWYH